MKKLMHVLLMLGVLGLSACASAQQKALAVKTDPIAERMLVYQLTNGGWPKQLEDKSVVRYEAPLNDALMAKIRATSYLHATIDNQATTREINALVKAYKATQNKSYLQAVEKGLAYLFEAQYKNGGWPQYYPDESSYRAEITFNDDAMVNVLNIMLDIITQTNCFDLVDKANIGKATTAFNRGVDCILKSQVLQNGKASIWAAQYDQHSLKPAKARAFEPAALSTSESVGIVRLLMRIEKPNAEIKNAITKAIDWFNRTKITGYKFDQLPDGKDKGLIADPSSTIWARFYDLQTNEPLFGDRDHMVYKNVAAISFERRNGYAWYGVWANNLINKNYPKWLKANGE